MYNIFHSEQAVI